MELLIPYKAHKQFKTHGEMVRGKLSSDKTIFVAKTGLTFRKTQRSIETKTWKNI
jgi:hypothetical protein